MKQLEGKAQSNASTNRQRGTLKLYRLEDMKAGEHGVGPAILEEAYFTCQVPKNWKFSISDNQDIVLTHQSVQGDATNGAKKK
jgi:N-methylhydantoinase A/oxoprolinase/acetone carboxylase beta subunit